MGYKTPWPKRGETVTKDRTTKETSGALRRPCLLPKLASCSAHRETLADQYLLSITIVAEKRKNGTGDEMEPCENLAMSDTVSQEVSTVEDRKLVERGQVTLYL